MMCFSLFQCCPGGGNLFDVYGLYDYFVPGVGYIGGQNHPGGLVRYGIITNSGQLFNSKDSATTENWFIPPDNPLPEPFTQFTLASAVGGYVTAGERVWTIEGRDRDTAGDDRFWVAQYDAATKQELRAVQLSSISEELAEEAAELLRLSPFTVSAFSPVVGPAVGGSAGAASFHSVSQNEVFAMLQRQDTGNFRNYFLLSESETTYLENVANFPPTGGRPPGTILYFVHCVASRNYPRCAGRIRRVTSNGGIETIGHFIGTLSVVEGPPHYLTATPVAEFFEGIGTSYEWVYFDASPTNWAGVLVRNVIPGFFHWIAVINGAIVLQRYGVAPDLFDRAVGGTPIMAPHVAHAHETLGDGYVVIPTKAYATEPTEASPTGVLQDQDRRFTLVCFKDGVEVWHTPPRYRPVICKSSSDRWLYCTGWEGGRAHLAYGLPTPRVQMPGTVYDGASPPNAGRHENGQSFWLIRHDGTQSAPCGNLLASPAGNGIRTWLSNQETGDGRVRVVHLFGPHITSGVTSTPANVLVRFGVVTAGQHDCVKNSELIGGSLPADAGEWFDVA